MAKQLTVESDLCCDENFIAEGMIDLTDVHVNGEFSLSNARLYNHDDIALYAPRMIVDKDMFCRDEFTVDGTVCLIGAHIGGKLSFTNAELTGAKLTEEQLCKNGITKMLTSGVKQTERRSNGRSSTEERQATGWLAWLLSSGKPGIWDEPDEVHTEEKIVNGASGLALVADGLRVELDMTCDAGFSAHGEIRLKGARIGQNLDFSDAAVENGHDEETEIANALNAEDIQAERMLMPARCKAGKISLRNGKMVELDDKRGVRPDQIDINGLSYETLIPPLDPETRLEWLRKNDYKPQPYDQLARSYRKLGYEESARKVQLEQERRQRDRLTSPIDKVWGYLQDVTIGYGYRPYRAAALFVLVVVLGMIWFSIVSLKQLDPDLQSPQFNALFYTLDVLVPFADFGQRDMWSSSFLNEVVKGFLAICGWTLAITAIAGINRKLTR